MISAIIFQTLFFLLVSYILLSSFYLLILTFAALFYKKEINPSKTKLNKFAIIIPSHNEELQIAATILAIKKANYPKSNFEIFVIADNCDDKTAQVSANENVHVVERTCENNKGKGQALDWFFKTHIKILDFDAVIIIDADTIMHKNFMPEVNKSLLCDDIKVVQGFYGVSNPKDSVRTALSQAALNIFHHLRPAGRNVIGATAGLKGNGMAFSLEIIKKYGWPAYSLVEDIEFSIKLLLDNILVYYNKDAIVYSEMASVGSQAKTQRRRWEGGRVFVFKKYAFALLKMFLKTRKLKFLDGFLDIFTLPLSLLIFLQVMCILISLFFSVLILYILLFCLACVFLYVFIGLIITKTPFYVWKSLMFAPFYMLWKIPIYFSMLTKNKKNKWQRTKRKSELK